MAISGRLSAMPKVPATHSTNPCGRSLPETSSFRFVDTRIVAIGIATSYCLDGENGLLLTPSIDHLLDKGFISFENSGELIVSPVAYKPSLEQMGVATDRAVNVGSFTEGQKHFLEYHRDAVLLRASRT